MSAMIGSNLPSMQEADVSEKFKLEFFILCFVVSNPCEQPVLFFACLIGQNLTREIAYCKCSKRGIQTT